jgi:ABC-type phosphate/phosphonate transport system ATPase subunit
VVSLEDVAAGRRFADRLLVLREGVLVFHGGVEHLDEELDARVGVLLR